MDFSHGTCTNNYITDKNSIQKNEMQCRVDGWDHVERTAPRFTGLYAIGRGFVRVGVVSYRDVAEKKE